MNRLAKLTAVAIAVITVISCYTLCVFAEDVYANIDSAKVSVDIPENFSVTNAEINSEGVLRYNASAQTADAKQTLHITSEKTDKSQELFNFKYLSKDEIDNELNSVKKGTSTLTGKSYKSVTGASYKEDSSCIIFMLYSSAIDGNKTISTATAYTVVNGELVTVTYSSNAGSLTVAQKGEFNSIVDSIKVKTLLAKPESIDIAGTFGTVLSTMLILGIVIIIFVVSYYIKNKNVKSNPKTSVPTNITMSLSARELWATIRRKVQLQMYLNTKRQRQQATVPMLYLPLLKKAINSLVLLMTTGKKWT